MKSVTDWEITFESASGQDIPNIFSLSKALIDQYEDMSSIDYEKVLQWVRNKIESEITTYTRICSRGETVGFYRLHEENGETELDDFYVLSPFRGKGIGTAVLEKCIFESKTPMFLYVFKKNEDAIRLYQRMGFVWVKDVSKTRMILRRDG